MYNTTKSSNGLLAINAAILLFFVSNAAFASTRVSLEGNVPLQDMGHSTGMVSPQEEVTMVLGLRLRNKDELEQLITQQSNPTSSLYHRWLTPEGFNDQFAPTQSDVETVSAFLRDHNIRVISITSNRLLIQARGTVADINSAFAVRLREFANGYSNTEEPTVPSDIGKIVQSIKGLSNTMMRSHTKRQESNDSNVVYSPQDIASAYNFSNANNLHHHKNDAILDGTGITLAIVSAFNYSSQDLNDYYKRFHINHTGTITNIPVGGESSKLEEETALDIEQASSQAPGANVLMYLASTPMLGTMDLAFNQMVCDNKADVVSFSWGLPDVVEGWAQILTTHEILEQAAAQGIVIFVASGDDGAYYQSGPFSFPAMAADYPSSDPIATAVGGTTMRMAGKDRDTEIAWTGSGGGISAFFDRPAWQRGKGVAEYGWYGQANQKRISTDVSLVSDPHTGYAIRFSGHWDSVGGTSAAAPNWAALWVLAEQATHGRIGGVNQTIYVIGSSSDRKSVFHDITSGDNGNGVGPGYKAGKGWDYPTGWGTPDGIKLVQWLVDHQPTAVASSN